MDLNKFKKIHFIGIGGIGISAIAKMMLLEGREVSGSDMNDSEIIQELKTKGVKIIIGHKPDNITEDINLVIYTEAIPQGNPERNKAKELNIPELSYPQILGEISKTKETIAVSGTNGKSTTTAMIGLILEAAGLDPLVIVGSKVKSFPYGNLRLGKGKYFVVEACEYKRSMMNLRPKRIVLTNIEAEHLDYYENLEEIIGAFQKYVNLLPQDGILALNNDDLTSSGRIKSQSEVITYGIDQPAHYQAKNIKKKEKKQSFDLYINNQKKERIDLIIPGRFNIYNALAAIALTSSLGINLSFIKNILSRFSNLWRRFEIIGQRKGAVIISDYAHHPTALYGTIQAAKEFYPKRRIMAVFEPHHHHRTKVLFNDFVQSLRGADLIILPEIFKVSGRESKEDVDISSEDLADEIKKRDKEEEKERLVFYAPNLAEAKELVLKNIEENDLVLMMGAGNIYKLAKEITEND